MRWGVELWDRFDDVSNYVHKGIEFCEKYEEFCKKRCSIENTYAKHLRKLIEAFEPKKKDTEENNTTHLKCYAKMLNELKDVAGQHELVAENIEERILVKLNQLVRSLKDERRKCIDDKEKYSADHVYSEELLEKCKQKYERAFKELEKAKELYFKIDNDDHASKSDIRKQKNVCDLKQNQLNAAEAEYGKQLCEANKSKSLFYREQLPSVLDSLQNIELKRINHLKSYICECVSTEVEVMPRIGQCHAEIENAARLIDPERDTEVPVALFKTGYSIPSDYVFEDLNEIKNSTNYSNGLNQSTNGSINSQFSSNSHHSHHQTSRQKKYRTISRLKGIFLLSSKTENDLYSLPPQQLKKELNRKIEILQTEIVKQNKEREGILKLKEIYSKNQKLGDAQATAHALEVNEEKLNNLNNELRNYQDILNEVESNGFVTQNPTNKSNNKQINQQHSASSNDYSTSSSSTNGGTRTNGTLPRDKLTQSSQPCQMHIYQSPSETKLNSTSQPSTPNSNHSNNNYAPSTPVKSINNSSGAYAVSPVSQLITSNHNNNNTQKMAPIVSSTHNESFDDDVDDDDDDYDDGCYEHPSAALKAAVNLKYNTAGGGVAKALTDSSTTTTTTKSDSIKSSNKINETNTKNISSSLADNTASIIYADSQYDHVDSNLYNANRQEDVDCDEKDLVIGTALVMYAFEGNVQNAMSIQENESLNVLERDKGDGWTLVKRLSGEKGYVPTDYIRIVYY